MKGIWERGGWAGVIGEAMDICIGIGMSMAEIRGVYTKRTGELE